MTKKTLKRSSAARSSPLGTQTEGVGGRPIDHPTPPRGGGYLDDCTIFEASLKGGENRARDFRLDELREMGLAKHWVNVASIVGYDYFLEIWEVLGSAENVDHISSGVRVYMPHPSLNERYQRNKLIRALGAQGKKSLEIQSIIKKELCEFVSRRHIDRWIQIKLPSSDGQ